MKVDPLKLSIFLLDRDQKKFDHPWYRKRGGSL